MSRGFTLIELIVVIAIIAVLIGLLSGGTDWAFQLLGHLVLGWPWYLARVLPGIDPNPVEVAVAVVSLLGVTAGVHLFGRWLYRHWQGTSADPIAPKLWPWRWTLRVVGLVVLLFACGTAAVGITHQTGWLLASPEPLTERRGISIREIAARTQSQNNLSQMGKAITIHNDAKGRVPASSFTPDGRPLHSWQTQLLPYLDQENLYKQLKLDRPWAHPDNAGPMAVRVKPFLHPMAQDDAVNGCGASHYAANVLTLGGDRKRTLQGYKQGTSNTVLAGEATTNPRAWGDPLNWRDPRLGINKHPDGFTGPFPGGVNVLMADGSVRFVTDKQAKGLLDGKFDD